MKTAYLDIETSYVGPYSDERLFKDYKNHKITVIGIRIIESDADSFLQLVGDEVSKERLLAALAGVERIVTYNGRSIPDKRKGYVGFDFPVIAAQLGVVLDRAFNHVDLCPLCWKANLWGGQKAVEQTLGLKRSLPGKDGKWADAAWKKYEVTKEESFKQQILAYNKEDVLMLRQIEQALKSR